MFLYRPFDLDSRVEREARALVGAGYAVEVIALTGEGLPERQSRDGYSIRRLSPHTRVTNAAAWLARSQAPKPIRRLAFRAQALLVWRAWSRRALRAARRAPADLLIGHDLDGMMPAVRARRRSGSPLIYDAHELFPDLAAKDRPERELRGWIRYESRLVRHADVVFAVTASRAAVMAERFGIEPPRVLRNVPEISTAEPDATEVDLRRELGIAGGTKMLLYLGGLQPVRGLEEAIRALALVPDSALVMMGSGDEGYVEGLRDLAESEGVAERVFIRAPVRPHEVVAVAAQADAGLILNHPVGLNNYLSLPNKIFESVAAGLPVVTSDFPDMAELVEHFDVGATCDPEDPADIARAVRAVLDDPEHHRELRENARRAAPELSWERESELFLSPVRELAGR
jgi:glycosyltransferase involved in cell wall biosynthesis